MPATDDSDLPVDTGASASRWALVIPGLCCLALAALADPIALIRSGLMDRSLAAVDPDVRTFSHNAVNIGRIGLCVVGGVLLIGALFWRWLGHCAPGFKHPARRSLGRNSLFVMLAVWLIAVVFVILGPKLLSPTAFSQFNKRLPSLAGAGFAAAAVLGVVFAIRSIFAGMGRGPGLLIISAAFAVICLGMIERIGGALPLFGYLEADCLSMMILGYILVGALVGRAPFFGRAVDALGLPLPSMGLALGAILTMSVSGWALFPLLGNVYGLDLGALRLVLLSVASVALLAEVRGRYCRQIEPGEVAASQKSTPESGDLASLQAAG